MDFLDKKSGDLWVKKTGRNSYRWAIYMTASKVRTSISVIDSVD
jgi:hypothetical protein